MVRCCIKTALFASVLVVLLGTCSSLLVTIGKRSKGSSNVQSKQSSVKPCTTDVDCTTLLNTSCIMTDDGRSKCLCEDLEPPIFGHCWNKDLHKNCTDVQDCLLLEDESVECRNSTCQCMVGYFVNEDFEICEKIDFVVEDAYGSGPSTSFSVFLLLMTSASIFFTGSALR